MSARKSRSKADRRRNEQNSAVGDAGVTASKKRKMAGQLGSAAAQFNNNVKPVLETDIRAIREAVGPLNGRTLGAQARSILLSVVYILQLAWRGTITEAVLGAAAYLGVSAANTVWPLVKHWKEKGEVKAPSLEKQGRASNEYPLKASILETKPLNNIEECIRD